MQDLETIINYPPSRDVYRYVWDGLQSLRGINPYEVVPGTAGAGEIYDLLELNYLLIDTPYPPVAQWLYSLLATGYETGGMNFVLVLACMPGILLLVLIWKRLRWWSRLIFLLHPFVWIHLVRDGHVDMWAGLLVVVGVMLVVKKRMWPGVIFLGLGFLVKPYVVVWLPLVFIHIWRNWGMSALVKTSAVFFLSLVIAYLPYRYDLSRYGDFVVMMQAWNPSPQRFWQAEFGISREVAQFAGMGILGIGIGLLMLRKKLDWTGLTLAGVLYLVTAPVVFPWYSLWLIAPAVLSGKWWVVILLGMVQWRLGSIV